MRAMNWFPENARRVGRCTYTYDSMIQHFAGTSKLETGENMPRTFFFWMSQFDDFLLLKKKLFTDT